MSCKAMLNLTRWLAARISGTVENIWCVSCRSRATIMDIEYVERANRKRVVKRAVGTCSSCGKTASSIVG